MSNFPVFQFTEGEWTSWRYVDILGAKVPAYFTSDPASLADYISSLQTKSDDTFVVGFPKSGVNEDAQCKYIYVARNPRDVAVSYFHFSSTTRPFNSGYNGPWEFFFKLFVEGKVCFDFWNEHVLGWWKHREDANVLFLKFEDLQKDLPSHVRMIAQFLNKPLSDELINRIAEQCTFEGMTKNTSFKFTDKKDSGSLLRKGVVGDWKNYFTPEQNKIFEKEVLEKLKGSGLEFDYELQN